MKKVLKVIVFIVLYAFFCITNTFAYCSDEDYKELKQLAKKIEIVYEPNEYVEGDVKQFLIYLYNNNLKFDLELSNGQYFFGTSSKMIELGYFDSGSNLTVYVYASSKSKCDGDLLNKIKIKLPYYNKYSERKECSNREDLDICKKWYDSSKISEKKFIELTTVEVPEEESSLRKIISILYKYWYFILIPVVIVAVVVITIKLKKKKSKNLLDI